MAIGFVEGRCLATPGREDRMSARVRIIGAGLAGSEAAWQCARRNVDVKVRLAEEVGIDSVFFSMSADPTQRGAHGFLHHLAEMAGHRELLAAPH